MAFIAVLLAVCLLKPAPVRTGSPRLLQRRHPQPVNNVAPVFVTQQSATPCAHKQMKLPTLNPAASGNGAVTSPVLARRCERAVPEPRC